MKMKKLIKFKKFCKNFAKFNKSSLTSLSILCDTSGGENDDNIEKDEFSGTGDNYPYYPHQHYKIVANNTARTKIVAVRGILKKHSKYALRDAVSDAPDEDDSNVIDMTHVTNDMWAPNKVEIDETEYEKSAEEAFLDDMDIRLDKLIQNVKDSIILKKINANNGEDEMKENTTRPRRSCKWTKCTYIVDVKSPWAEMEDLRNHMRRVHGCTFGEDKQEEKELDDQEIYDRFVTCEEMGEMAQAYTIICMDEDKTLNSKDKEKIKHISVTREEIVEMEKPYTEFIKDHLGEIDPACMEKEEMKEKEPDDEEIEKNSIEVIAAPDHQLIEVQKEESAVEKQEVIVAIGEKEIDKKNEVQKAVTTVSVEAELVQIEEDEDMINPNQGNGECKEHCNT